MKGNTAFVALMCLLSTAALANPPAVEPIETTIEVAPLAEPADQVVAAVERQDAELQQLRDQLVEMRTLLDSQSSDIASLQDTNAELEDRLESKTRGKVSIGGAVVVAAGEVVDDAVAFGEDLIVLGFVKGDAVSFGGNVYVRNGGVVGEDTISFGGQIITEPGAQLRGDRVSMDYNELPSMGPQTEGLLSWLYSRLIFLLSFAGAGVLVVGLFPARVGRIAEAVTVSPLRSAVAGTLLPALLCTGGGLFMITGIGIPITVVIWGMLALAWFMGFIGVCQAVGDRLPFEHKQSGRWVAFLVGSLFVACLTSLPLIGWITMMSVSVLGMGAALTTRFGS